MRSPVLEGRALVEAPSPRARAGAMQPLGTAGKERRAQIAVFLTNGGAGNQCASPRHAARQAAGTSITLTTAGWLLFISSSVAQWI